MLYRRFTSFPSFELQMAPYIDLPAEPIQNSDSHSTGMDFSRRLTAALAPDFVCEALDDFRDRNVEDEPFSEYVRDCVHFYIHWLISLTPGSEEEINFFDLYIRDEFSRPMTPEFEKTDGSYLASDQSGREYIADSVDTHESDYEWHMSLWLNPSTEIELADASEGDSNGEIIQNQV
jgi:hypothetical protein